MNASTDRHCWDDVIGPDERLVASRYQARRRWGRRPALLLVDCYRKVFADRPMSLADGIDEFPATCGLAAWEALPSLEALLARARELGVPVVHTTGAATKSPTGAAAKQPPTGAATKSPTGAAAKQPPTGASPGEGGASRLGAATLRARSPGEDEAGGYAFVPELSPIDGELVVTKSRASAFFGTPLSTWLRQLDVDCLVVAGESTSGCVRASVVDAYSHGFPVAVVEEATFDRSPLSHKVNLFDMHLKYASVVHLEAAPRYLAPDATP